MKLYASVKDETGERKVIEDTYYASKAAFAYDLRHNGYTVSRTYTEKEWELMSQGINVKYLQIK